MLGFSPAVMPCHTSNAINTGFSLHHFPRPLATGCWAFPSVGFYTLVSAGFFQFHDKLGKLAEDFPSIVTAFIHANPS